MIIIVINIFFKKTRRFSIAIPKAGLYLENIWPRHDSSIAPSPIHPGSLSNKVKISTWFLSDISFSSQKYFGERIEIHNFPHRRVPVFSFRRETKWILLRLLCQHKASTKLFSFPPSPLWICMIPWKSNLNLFQRHTKATRRRKIVILKGFPSQRGKAKDFSGEGKGNYMQRRGVGGGDIKFVEPERANRRMLYMMETHVW